MQQSQLSIALSPYSYGFRSIEAVSFGGGRELEIPHKTFLGIQCSLAYAAKKMDHLKGFFPALAFTEQFRFSDIQLGFLAGRRRSPKDEPNSIRTIWR